MDLRFLRPLYEQPGPWVSVYLDASRDRENADREIELRWRALRERLAAQGADAATLDAVDTAVREHPYQAGRYGLAVFARAGTVAMTETLADPPPADGAAYGPLPHVMPLLVQRGEQVPYVRVLADRTGADLAGLAVGAAPRRRAATGGEDFPLHKVRGGGWSHRRILHAVEEAWRRNADDMAAAAVNLAETVGAEVIVVGGDVRATQLFVERLPERWRDRTVRTDASSRHAGADPDALDDVTAQTVAELAQRRTREVIDRYQAQRGDDFAGEAAGGGLAAVVEALLRGQAETILLVNDPSSTDTLWIGPEDPRLVAVDEAALRAAGVQAPQRVRADAALVRAMAGTGAGLVLVDRAEVSPPHGIGAVLRYAEAATGARGG